MLVHSDMCVYAYVYYVCVYRDTTQDGSHNSQVTQQGNNTGGSPAG
jgi:hypothetical protein